MTENSGYSPYPPPYGTPGQVGPPPGYPYAAPPPPYTAPPTQPTKRSWPWIVTGIAAVVVLVFSAVAVLLLAADDEDDEQEVATVVVTYELTGPPASVEVAYWGSDDSLELDTVTLPWQLQVTKGGDNNYVSVAARRAEPSDEPLRCRIAAAGKTITQRESVGPTVTCDGHIGEEE